MKEPYDTIVLIFVLLTIILLACLVLVLAYRIGLQLQWQHVYMVNDCIAHNLNATDGSHCIV
jgi:hypothetical protein